ncbi:MAG: hypothetical protein ACLR6W_08035 [Evtepia sp.]
MDGWVEDDRLYLRVVDYKTGRKSFDLTECGTWGCRCSLPLHPGGGGEALFGQ